MGKQSSLQEFNIEQKKYYGRDLFAERKPRSQVINEIRKEVNDIISCYPRDPTATFIKPVKLYKSGSGYYILTETAGWGKQFSELDFVPSPSKVLDWWRALLVSLQEIEADELGWEMLTLDQLRFSAHKDRENNPVEIKLIPPELAELFTKYAGDEQHLSEEYFRAPELITGETINREKSLVFSLGVIIYYWLAEKPPYHGQDKSEVVDRVISASKLELCDLRPDLAPELGALVDRCLAHNPAERPDFAELQNKLAELSTPELTLAPATYKPLKRKKSRRVKLFNYKQKLKLTVKRRWHMLLVAALVLLLIPLMIFTTGREEHITANHSSEEVVTYFYQAIDEKNVMLLDDTAEVDLGNLRRMVSESHVMETMRQFYEMEPAEEAAPEDLAEEDELEEELAALFGVEDLKLELKEEKAEKRLYKAQYIFFANTEEGRTEWEARDKVQLKISEERWQISKVSGFIADLITGEFAETENNI